MSNNTETEHSRDTTFSTGKGIVIATLLICTTTLTIFLALLFFTDIFVDNSSVREEMEREGKEDDVQFAYFLFTVITAIPLLVAYKLTDKALEKSK